ncbi:MAG: transcription-repair coupling factor [Desulfovibrionaceae bacterium]|nr:transcription-repair coupling factor [Desulfovibrionaceae bacterium]
MDRVNELFSLPAGPVRIRRAGMATRCALACRWAERGGTAVVLASGREEYGVARGLLRLFSPGMSDADISAERPMWERPVLELPADSLVTAARPDWPRTVAVFRGLQQKRGRCLLVTPEALLLRFMPLSFFHGRELSLRRGMEILPEMVLEQAVEWGYARVPMVARVGEMAMRGDILDIFPAGWARPVRLEFFGDELEDMRLFDPESQRSSHPLDAVDILPVTPLGGGPAAKAAAACWKRCRAEGRLSENALYALERQLERGAKGILPGTFHEDASTLEDWLPEDTLWLLPGEADFHDMLDSSWRALAAACEREDGVVPQPAWMALREPPSVLERLSGRRQVFAEPLVMGVEAGGESFPDRQLRTFDELLPGAGAQDRPWQQLVQAIRGWQKERRQIIFCFASGRGRQKFLKLAGQDGLMPQLRYASGQRGLFALVTPFREGADIAWDGVLVLGERIIQPRGERAARPASHVFKGLDRFDDLEPGDLLVHRDYGIGRFSGLHHLALDGAANDYLLIEYSGDDKLYVPADRLSLIQRFKGGDGAAPALDRLGSAAWSAGREKARKAVEKIAADLVEMYAWRQIAKGFRYDPPGELYHEFSATFGFEETPDQARAIQDVLDDMEKDRPMDRLVCGDVGFGKTEVAMRAAFRAASEGRQVALLCPTTVLAEQHFQTFRARMAGFPVNVGLLSRFVSRQKQQETLGAAARGQVDILIGTHRLLSSDVHLPNLGLLILDEEQRFGVRHKEKLKAMRRNVDVLTLTATPIPRTLQLSMSGIRDLSVIETAPQDRKPVATALVHRDAEVLRTILQREIAREGQVFWVCNRVRGLEGVADYVRTLVPGARVGMAHGQMAEGVLEKTMREFWHGGLDVLVCTSIVESGLDFPRANTLIVDQAQMFGLGQLYQLRGRVGRSDRQAYAVFIVPDEARLSRTAEERLRIILDMDYLGAGFQIAVEDLRLRGAGNILGESQSGHIGRIGLDMYLEMLEESVATLKGMPQAATETEMNLALPAHIPETYISDGRERLRCYKALTSAVDGAAREDVALGMRDRFGPFPVELENFLAVLDFKQHLSSLQAVRADVHPDRVRCTWEETQTALSPEKLVALLRGTAAVRLLPPATLELPLDTSLSFAEGLAAVRAVLEGLRAGAAPGRIASSGEKG